MSTQTLVHVALPTLIALIMWGMGLSLSMKDFIELKKSPRTIYGGLICQMVFGFLLAVALVFVFNLDPLLAGGLLLVAATPGGPTAVMYAHLAKGNVAANVTLTVINSLLSIATVPLVAIGVQMFLLQSETNVPIHPGEFVKIVLLMVVPLAIGIATNQKFPDLSKTLDKYVQRAAIVLLAAIIVFGVTKEWRTLQEGIFRVGMPILALNVGGLMLGYGAGVILKLTRPDKISLVMEMGVRRSALSLSIAMDPNIFNSTEMALPSALYSVLMYITAGVAVWVFNRSRAS